MLFRSVIQRRAFPLPRATSLLPSRRVALRLHADTVYRHICSVRPFHLPGVTFALRVYYVRSTCDNCGTRATFTAWQHLEERRRRRRRKLTVVACEYVRYVRPLVPPTIV